MIAMENPYEAPTDIHGTPETINRRSLVGIEFESDWSAQGLKHRRKQWWHRSLDISFALFSLLWLGSLVSATGSPYAGVFCVLTPIWVLLSIVWFSNLGFRNGESFHRKYPGFSGKVRGRVDGRSVVVHGPDVSLATRIRNCLQCHVSASRATLQPPGFETSLPIAEPDITRKWAATVVPGSPSPSELLSALSDQSNAIQIEDVVHGSDLRTLPCWRIWRLSGGLLVGIGIVALLWSLISIVTLPSWILNPPGHYQMSDHDISRIAGPAILGVIGLGFLIAGIWQWSRTWRQIGRFSVCIDQNQISIANKVVAFSYHNQALQHFRWTDAGIVVRDAGRRVLFAIPARWFDDEQQQLLKSWYDHTTQPPSRSHYIGPKV